MKIMKKTFLAILVIVMVFALAGCKDAGIYKEAREANEAGDYVRVVELLDTIPNYKDSDNLREYANAVIAFRDALAKAENHNAEIDRAAEPAQEILDSGKVPLDETALTDLQVAISTLRELKVEVIAMPAELAEIPSVTAELTALPDIAEQIETLQNASVALENSIKQMEQITNPTGDFVIDRLNQIQEIDEIRGVTEDNDPNGKLNKQGGYTSSTYFSTPLVNQASVYGADLIDKGTEAGGCLEVYQDANAANGRDAYLTAIDPSFPTGSHVVYGTIVIRTSNKLTATQQNELTEQIKEKLVELQ